MKGLIHSFFRLLFGLALVGVGLQGIYNIEKTTPHAQKTYDLIISQPQLKNIGFLHSPAIKNHIGHLVLAHYGLFIAGGLFATLGFGLSKLLVFLGVAANLALVHNVYFYRDEKIAINSLKYLAVFGGAWNL